MIDYYAKGVDGSVIFISIPTVLVLRDNQVSLHSTPRALSPPKEVSRARLSRSVDIPSIAYLALSRRPSASYRDPRADLLSAYIYTRASPFSI